VDGHELDNLDMSAELMRLELLSMPCLVFLMRQWKMLVMEALTILGFEML
jgi:hypothetical protein